MTDPHSRFSQNDLTAKKFEGLLLRLDANRERAGARYEEIRWKLVRFFQWGCCPDAEDLVDETFNRVAEKLASEGQDIQDVTAFLWGVAKNIRQEALRREARTVHLPDLPGAEESVVDEKMPDQGPHDASAQQKRLKCLRKCIQRLSAEDRRVLLTYHSPRASRPEVRRRLAEENGITMAALRVRVNRLRFKLEQCIRECLGAIQD